MRRRPFLVSLLGLAPVAAGIGGRAAGGAPPAGAAITFQRFFGSCEATYGASTDVAAARGECGIITTLVNRFNATNARGVVVRPQIVEWAPYYQQLTARILTRDVPTIAVMHGAQLGDFVRHGLVEPLDEGFAGAGIDVNDFTPQARRAVTVAGRVYALPWDTHSWLWHVNLGLMRRAGLLEPDGSPTLPRTADELFALVERFKVKTGRPYFLLAAVPDPAANARTFYTLLRAQDGTIFPDGYRRARLSTPAARTAFALIDRLYREGHVKPDQDYSASTASFLNGEGGVNINGTWVIDDFVKSAATPSSALSGGYAARPFVNLFTTDAVWADNHVWVLPKGGSGGPERAAALDLLRFLWDRNLEWARAGHLPASRTFLADPRFLAMPFRTDVAPIGRIGVGMAHEVPHQFGLQTILGEEIGNMLTSGKPVDAALADAEDRVNDLLANSA